MRIDYETYLHPEPPVFRYNDYNNLDEGGDSKKKSPPGAFPAPQAAFHALPVLSHGTVAKSASADKIYIQAWELYEESLSDHRFFANLDIRLTWRGRGVP